jgi:hypothetical protein
MSYLLAVGCSWTDHNYFSFQHEELDCSWPKWPEYVGKHLGLPAVNKGRSGSSNEYAYIEIMDAVLSDDPPSHICWQLTDWSRLQLGRRRIIPCKRWDTFAMESNSEKKFRKDNSSGEYLMGLHTLPLALDGPIPILENTLFYIEKVIMLCRKLNIKLNIFQSDVPMWPFTSDYWWWYLDDFRQKHPKEWEVFFLMIDERIENCFLTEKVLSKLISGNAFAKVEKIKPVEVYGWPIWKEFGGKWLSAESKISELDSHPDAIGQANLGMAINKWIDDVS